MTSTYNLLQRIKKDKMEVRVEANAPRFKSKAKWEDLELEKEKIEVIDNVHSPGSKDLFYSDTKHCPWPTKPHNISQKARNILYNQNYGIVKIPFGNKKYLYVIPRENVFQEYTIDGEKFPGLYDVMMKIKDDFWAAVKELIDNIETVKQLTILHHLAKHYVLQNRTKDEAIKIASVKAHHFMKNTDPPQGFEITEKENRLMDTLLYLMPDIRHIQQDYNCHKAEEEYNRIMFELEMMKGLDDEDTKWHRENLQKLLDGESLQYHKQRGFQKTLFDFRFWFSEIELGDPEESAEALQIRKLELENQLKEKKIDQQRLNREMLVEYDARIQATEAMSTALINVYESSINNFTNIIKNELSDIMEKLSKPRDESKKHAIITKRTLNRIRSFCNDIKRMNTEFQLESIDTFVDSLLEKSNQCTTGNEEYEDAEKDLSKFIEHTIKAIDTDNSRLSKLDRIDLIDTDYDEIFQDFDELFTNIENEETRSYDFEEYDR